MRIEGLAPSIDDRCSKLVLGSMPGAASLTAARYYAHPRNAFWPIVYDVLTGGREQPPAKYEARLQFLLEHGVGLWDVLQSCERQGSLDTAIRQAEANDFAELLAQYPSIRDIYFNGGAAYELFRRHAAPKLEGRGLRYHKLPSTSPAHAVPYAKKAEAWRKLRDDGEGDGR